MNDPDPAGIKSFLKRVLDRCEDMKRRGIKLHRKAEELRQTAEAVEQKRKATERLRPPGESA